MAKKLETTLQPQCLLNMQATLARQGNRGGSICREKTQNRTNKQECVCTVFVPYECRWDLHSLLLPLEDHVQLPNPNKINFHFMDQFENIAII